MTKVEILEAKAKELEELNAKLKDEIDSWKNTVTTQHKVFEEQQKVIDQLQATLDEIKTFTNDMSINTYEGKCTIHFTDRSEQAKAFNILIHGKIPFSGIDTSTIIINKQACEMLKSKNIEFEVIK